MRLPQPRVAILALALLAFVSRAATAEDLVMMISTNAVEITSNYTGTEIAIFGAIQRDGATIARGSPYEVVVTVKGPSVPLVVREKEKVGFIWVNSDQRKFGDVPGFYAVLSTIPLENIADPNSQRNLRLGPHALTASLEALPEDATSIAKARAPSDAFEKALVRLRRDQGLYLQNPLAVSLLRANTFKANVALPANAPLGRYEVTTYLFSGGVTLARETSAFFVRKIGFEASTAAAARSRPLIYGLMAAGMAVLVGWLANMIFRRD